MPLEVVPGPLSQRAFWFVLYKLVGMQFCFHLGFGRGNVPDSKRASTGKRSRRGRDVVGFDRKDDTHTSAAAEVSRDSTQRPARIHNVHIQWLGHWSAIHIHIM
jgi:hypothetical protein